MAPNKELSVKEVHDELIDMFAQIKAKEIMDECNVTDKYAKRLLLTACRIAMKEKYKEMWGEVEES